MKVQITPQFWRSLHNIRKVVKIKNLGRTIAFTTQTRIQGASMEFVNFTNSI